jgi:hypothetical protein
MNVQAELGLVATAAQAMCARQHAAIHLQVNCCWQKVVAGGLQLLSRFLKARRRNRTQHGELRGDKLHGV